MTTRDQLCSAVHDRCLVEFTYEGHSRTIEPHVVFPDSDGDWHLEGWQTAGYSSRPTTKTWRRYKINTIQSLVILTETFTGTREPYVRESERYNDACCKL